MVLREMGCRRSAGHNGGGLGAVGSEGTQRGGGMSSGHCEVQTHGPSVRQQNYVQDLKRESKLNYTNKIMWKYWKIESHDNLLCS
uniref:Uncharacterized protein n=1 Tax=Triticum urartu TaxID=4572 RepID=A0A8R7UFV9_TRIUA